MEIVLGSAILAEVLLGMFFTRRAASLQEESCSTSILRPLLRESPSITSKRRDCQLLSNFLQPQKGQ